MSDEPKSTYIQRLHEATEHVRWQKTAVALRAEIGALRRRAESAEAERDALKRESDDDYRAWWTACRDALVSFGHSPQDVDEIDAKDFAYMIGEEVKEAAKVEAERDALRATAKIARVQVTEGRELWLHLDGGGRYKASLNVSHLISPTRSFNSPGPIVQGGVREAIDALLSPAPQPVEPEPPKPCVTCGGSGRTSSSWNTWGDAVSPSIPCPDCSPGRKDGGK